MFYNLKALENFGFWRDIKVMFMTVFAMLGKKYTPKETPKKNGKEEKNEEKANV
jgi:lipopolysaccharide/colanic/teichoic acid biosynthesis glycosyltransferase